MWRHRFIVDRWVWELIDVPRLHLPLTRWSLRKLRDGSLAVYGTANLMVCMEVEMAQKVTVALEDDLDGGPADETVLFAFEGADYEIDLSSRNASAFRKQLTPFIEHARNAGRGHARRSARTAASRRERRRRSEVRCGQPGQPPRLRDRAKRGDSLLRRQRLGDHRLQRRDRRSCVDKAL